MNKRYLIGAIVIVFFIALAIYSFNDQKIGYADIATAKSSDEVVQISGKWLKDQETSYDSENNKFVFHIQDDKNTETKVIYEGAKPNNFELADKVVIKGKFTGNHFQATQILTKCPSKYEGKQEDVLNPHNK